ncbi:CLUMA_CG013426, isoform A [Clunio marinus]|uniref:CLUMA_CG013426, isoform A n=1 Tax=Clunio marinus TaxID=568069 RepID=A0A1J1IM48_9DIPT|nr:CLUMA_CG013426, isoform A [Clunio marinus]
MTMVFSHKSTIKKIGRVRMYRNIFRGVKIEITNTNIYHEEMNNCNQFCPQNDMTEIIAFLVVGYEKGETFAQLMKHQLQNFSLV